MIADQRQPAGAAAGALPTQGGGSTANTTTKTTSAGASQQQASHNQAAAASKQQKISSANLLSPNAALEQTANSQVPSAGGVNQVRRKSTLSANGFFIDYSCTRRRSSARPETLPRDPLQAALSRNQFLRNVISPVATRRPSAMVAGSMSSAPVAGRSRSRSSYAGPANSAAVAAAAASHLLQVGGGGGGHATGGAGRMAAGSRKTSIFDPAGHSLVASGASAAIRRKSTMVTGGAGGLPVQSAGAIAEAATMLAVSRQAAALQSNKKAGRNELVQRVPVIGCSPTSIRASLAALDETRRYEKLLRKLNRHQKRKEKEKEKISTSHSATSGRRRAPSSVGNFFARRPSEAAREFNKHFHASPDDHDEDLESLCDIDLLESDDGALMSYGEDDDHDDRARADNRSSQSDSSDNRGAHHARREQPARLSLRRKSIRAIRDAAALLNKAGKGRRRRHGRHGRRLSRWAPANLRARLQGAACEPRVDGLSISSTLSFASSQTSLPSMNRFLDDLSLYDDDDQEEDYDEYNQDEEEEEDYDDDEDDERARENAGGRRNCSPTNDEAADDECFERERSTIKGGEGHLRSSECYVNTARSLSADLPGESGAQRQARLAGAANQAPRQRQVPSDGRNINELIAHASGDGGGESDNNNDSRGLSSEAAVAAAAQTTSRLAKKERGNGASLRGSLVRKAMRKIAAKLGATNQGEGAAAAAADKVVVVLEEQGGNEQQVSRKPRRRKSSMAPPMEGERRASGRPPPLAKRRRSVSVSGGLNYWHYYYYLRDNSLDAADELPLTATSQPEGVGGGGVIVSGPGQAAGTPMGETERRARLYVNYSLARLEILNCNSDPVAKLADKLAQLAAIRQQEDEYMTPNSCGEEQPSNWNQLFDFANQSTDVSLTLSTSSTTLSSSSTTRNSSSMSSPVSTVSSSLACVVNVRPSTASGTTPTTTLSAKDEEERQRAQQQRRTRRRRRHLDDGQGDQQQQKKKEFAASGHQVSSSSTSSGGCQSATQKAPSTSPTTTTTTSSTASSVVQMQQSLAAQWQRPSAVGRVCPNELAIDGGGGPPPPPSHSISSNSIGHFEQQQQQASRWQQGQSYAAFPAASDHYQRQTSRANELPGGQFEDDYAQQARRAQAFCEPPSIATTAAAGEQPIHELHPLDQGAPSSQPLESIGNQRHRPSAGRHSPANLTSINDPFTCSRPPPVDEPEDDFERFSRMNQHGGSSPTRSERSLGASSQRSSLAPSSSTPGNRHFGRDAHFRFSVKATRGARPHQVAKTGEHSPGAAATAATSVVPWGQGMAAAASRRSSRTFLSWDRLEAPPAASTQVGVPGGLAMRRVGVANSSSHLQLDSMQVQAAQVVSRAELERRLRDFSPAPPQGGKQHQTASGGGKLEASRFIIGDHPASRRSFRQPRGQATQGAGPTAAPLTENRAGWRFSYFVSPSRSFLFQRKQSSSTAIQPKGGGSSKKRQSDYDNDGARDNEPKSKSTTAAAAAEEAQQQKQRREADELLGEFEAQMSEAASLAAASAGKQQQPPQSSSGIKRQQQLHLACKSGPPSRSSSSSLSSRSFASFSQAASETGHQQQHQNNVYGQHAPPSCCHPAGQQQASCESSSGRNQMDWPKQSQSQSNQVCPCGEPTCQAAASASQLQQRLRATNRNETEELSSDGSTSVASQQQSRRAAPVGGSLQVPGGANWRVPPPSPPPPADQTRSPSGELAQGADSQRQQQTWTLANNNTTTTTTTSGWPASSEGVNNHKLRSRSGQGDNALVAQASSKPSSASRQLEATDEWLALAVTQTSRWPTASGEENNGQWAPSNRRQPFKAEVDFCQPGDHFASQGFLQQQQQHQSHQIGGRDSNSLRARAHSTGAGGQQRQSASHLVATAAAAAVASQTNRSMQMLSSLACQEAQEVRQQQQQKREEQPPNSSKFALTYGRSLSSLVAHSTKGGRSNQLENGNALGSSSAQTSPNRRQYSPPSREQRQQFNVTSETSEEVKVEQENQAIHLHALNMLRKNSFNCTVLGARQVGKRTIVICFVKLLNEFKLAADEYKKERMLTKLVECSERLRELTSRQEEQEQQQQQLDEQLAGRQRRTSRLNSWLPGGERMKSLLNLSPGGKRRLNSVANLLGGREQSSSSRNSPNRLTGNEQHQMVVMAPEGEELDGNNVLNGNSAQTSGGGHQRRHTTIEGPASFELQRDNAGELQQQQQFGRLSVSSRYLNVAGGGRGQLLQTNCNNNNNKSDSNIHYRANNFDCQEKKTTNTTVVHQLQVPSLEATALRKHSDPTSCRSNQQRTMHEVRQRAPSYSPMTAVVVQDRRQSRGQSAGGSVFLEAPTTNGNQPQSPSLNNNKRRHTTLSAGILGPSGVTQPLVGRQQRSQSRAVFNVGNEMGGHQVARGASSSSGARRPSEVKRNQSICLSKRSKRLLLSLKELNRRKFAIKFNTRRQISDAYLEQVESELKKRETQHQPRASHRRSILLQLVQATALPDAFVVVYSINDRNSFAYAKSLVKQLRTRCNEIPLPIVLVANKSDLERNREIKSEEGRALARSFACKFIEISCTIGFNLDTLLVGLRTQLVLRHHIILNSILRPGFRYKPARDAAANRRESLATKNGTQGKNQESRTRRSFKETTVSTGNENNTKVAPSKSANSGDNILVRFYKRYVIDNYEQNSYDCDNFSKL